MTSEQKRGGGQEIPQICRQNVQILQTKRGGRGQKSKNLVDVIKGSPQHNMRVSKGANGPQYDLKRLRKWLIREFIQPEEKRERILLWLRERESVMAVRHSWRCGALSSAAAGGPRRLLAPLRPNKKNRDAAILHNILWHQKI